MLRAHGGAPCRQPGRRPCISLPSAFCCLAWWLPAPHWQPFLASSAFLWTPALDWQYCYMFLSLSLSLPACLLGRSSGRHRTAWSPSARCSLLYCFSIPGSMRVPAWKFKLCNSGIAGTAPRCTACAQHPARARPASQLAGSSGRVRSLQWLPVSLF